MSETKSSYFIEVRYYDTYYFATVVQNLMRHPFNYLRDLEGFFGDAAVVGLIQPFPKHTPLHRFIAWTLFELFEEDAAAVAADPVDARGNRRLLLAERALKFHDRAFEHAFDLPAVDRESARNDIERSIEDFFLGVDFDWLVSQITNEVFYLLFANRGFLLQFNEHAAMHIRDLDNPDIWGQGQSHLLRRLGVLARAQPPRWAQRAVYYRDRGLCVICACDLSGLISLGGTPHYDHVVPLADGGMNCVTNLQLLCETCNLRKADGASETSELYQAWF